MPPALPSVPLIDDDTAAFMQRGVSVIVGSRSSASPAQASLMRAVGCRVSPDRRAVTVLLHAPPCRALLDDIRATGQVAVVFSQPSTHRTLQFKARDARLGEATPQDWALASQYQQAFAREVEPLGISKEFAMAIMGWRPADLMALHFTPVEAYDQTPGPRAGTRLEPAA